MFYFIFIFNTVNVHSCHTQGLKSGTAGDSAHAPGLLQLFYLQEVKVQVRPDNITVQIFMDLTALAWSVFLTENWFC